MAPSPATANTPKSAVKSMFGTEFWLDALVTIGGFAAADLITRLVGSRIPMPASIKPFVAPFIGPIVVVAASPVIKGHYGHMIRLGASVHAANTLLGFVGVKALGAGGA